MSKLPLLAWLGKWLLKLPSASEPSSYALAQGNQRQLLRTVKDQLSTIPTRSWSPHTQPLYLEGISRNETRPGVTAYIPQACFNFRPPSSLSGTLC